MTVLSTYAKIQSLVAASSGITSAPTVMPTALNDVDLPCSLCFPGAATLQLQAAGLHRSDRLYTLRVFVKPVAQGAGVDEGFQEVLPIIQALGLAFNQNVGLDNTVDHISELRDSGVRGDMEYAGIAYHGFEMSFSVTEKTIIV